MKVKSKSARLVGAAVDMSSSNLIKNRLQDSKLDLSMMDLEEVPVKKIAELSSKTSQIDLSCNRIITIPSSFCELSHILWLDLSKNGLSSLPYDFGQLVKLQHLDLYENEIEVLPVSFSQLRSLRWLDLKNNPLEGHLKTIAGDCLDSKQCKLCARKVVSFMQVVEAQLIREQKEEKKRLLAEEGRRKAREEILEKRDREKQVVEIRKKMVKENKVGTKESIQQPQQPQQRQQQQQQQQQQQAPKSPSRADKKKVANKNSVNASNKAQVNGTKTKAHKRGLLNADVARSNSGRGGNRKGKGGGMCRSLTVSLLALFIMVAAVLLLLFLNFGDGKEFTSLEEFQRQLPIVVTRGIQVGCFAVMTTVDYITEWWQKDGVVLASHLAEGVCSVLNDVLDIFEHAVNHLRSRLFELLGDKVSNSATVTTNAKKM